MPDQAMIDQPAITDSPVGVLSAWPREVPVAAWGVGPASPWSRWAIIAPVDAARTLRLTAPAPLAEWFPASNASHRPGDPPFTSGWIGWLSYDLGGSIEPRTSRAHSTTGWPLAILQRCDGAWCYDKLAGRWHATGSCVGRTPPRSRVEAGAARVALSPEHNAEQAYTAGVARVVEYIRAGDAYQVNLAHRFSGTLSGGLLDLFVNLCDRAAPWYGSYICDTTANNRLAVLSASPELFLSFDPSTRRLTTRPMKGTRPAARAAELLASPKDRAELAMIVDLMRNDLGRLCRTGSISVDEPRVIEPHGPLVQGVATISGELRADHTLADAISACFPPGSVTGAPKIRAMQIIAELEPHARGPYCGCIGYISDSGHAEFNVAIRTLTARGTADQARADAIHNAEASYWAGAGIVADSVPRDEWLETIDKAAALRSIIEP